MFSSLIHSLWGEVDSDLPTISDDPILARRRAQALRNTEKVSKCVVRQGITLNFSKVEEPVAPAEVGQAGESIVGGLSTHAHERSFSAFMQGLYERVVGPFKKDDDPAAVAAFTSFVKTNFGLFFHGFGRIECDSYSRVIEDSNASPSVKAGLERAAALLDEEGITPHTRLSRTQIRQMCARTVFHKDEKNMYYGLGGTSDKTPRIISGSTPEFTLLVASFINPFGRKLKHKWNTDNFVTYASGMNGLDVGAWAVAGEHLPKVCEDDVSAFDGSVRPWALRLENWVFEKCGAPRAALDLLDNLEVTSYHHSGFSFKHPGQRWSGVPHTSCGNSLLNALFHCWIYISNTGQSPRVLKSQFRIIVMGDDSVIMARYPVDYQAGMNSLGFKAVTICRETILETGFCSMFFVPVRGGLALIGNPGKMIAGLMHFPCNSDIPLSELVAGAARSAKLSFGYDPELVRVLDHYILEGVHGVQSAFKITHTDLSGVWTEETLLCQHRRWGVTPRLGDNPLSMVWIDAAFGEQSSVPHSEDRQVPIGVWMTS